MDKLQKISNLITPQFAAVLIAGGFIFLAILLWAPSDAREWAFGANGLFWTCVTYFLRYSSVVRSGEDENA